VLVAFPSEDRPPSAWWSPEDLQFHRRSRVGYHGDGYGGTYRFEGQFPPLSALPTAGDPAELAFEFKPVDLGEVESSDPPLTKVIESRKSIREYDEANPITADQLGELLFRTVRVRRQFNDPKEELLDRPVPSGGSINSIVTYAAVRSCQGIEPGLYRYDGLRHGLELVSGDPAGVGALISAVPLAPGPVAVAPQVVLVFTARFGRVMWKYESMAYALILKDLGVIFQSLYLVSTAMGLAPCAQGGGDSSIFAKLAGLDPLDESSLGEFAIGSIS